MLLYQNHQNTELPFLPPTEDTNRDVIEKCYLFQFMILGGKLLHRCLTLQGRIYFTSGEIVCTIYLTDGKL